MNAKDAIRSSLDMCLFVLNTYLSDLEDADLMRRPAAGCNTLAWQLGHLISSESQLVDSVCPGKGGKLPEGFAAAHSKETIGVDDPAKFNSKQEYQSLFEDVRAATVAAFDELPEADLDAPSPETFRKNFPRVGDMFNLIATHPLMHAGQFVVVRRQLGKPIVI